MPIEDENKNVIGAIGFMLYDHLDSPLIARVGQLESDLRVAKRQLSLARRARVTLDDGETTGVARGQGTCRPGGAAKRDGRADR